MSEFGDKLSRLCSSEMIAAKGDAERSAEMVERLISALAFTIAISGGGQPDAMDTLLKGAEAYLYECAAEHSKVAKIITAAVGRLA
jgi:hypothetical protein